MRSFKNFATLVILLFSTALYSTNGIASILRQRSLRGWRQAASTSAARQQSKPAPAPERWRGLIGEYGPDTGILYILEQNGSLCSLFKGAKTECLLEISKNSFKYDHPVSRAGQTVTFSRDAKGWAKSVKIGSIEYSRRKIEPEDGAPQLRVVPLRPVNELLREARSSLPPKEVGDFLPANMVELKALIPTIKLDIRYATTNNLFGTVFYSEPRAFMQRPAAESLERANRKLNLLGYGLLIHDAYRPWYVTKVFWEATPDDKKIFVADPSKGSRHNRGAAVDLTLYDLKTGKPVEMVSTYDETTDRAYPDYPGGTSLQRWYRQLLRDTMESEGFSVYEAEWWHFDYKDWRRYPIGNLPFDQLGTQ